MIHLRIKCAWCHASQVHPSVRQQFIKPLQRRPHLCGQVRQVCVRRLQPRSPIRPQIEAPPVFRKVSWQCLSGGPENNF